MTRSVSAESRLDLPAPSGYRIIYLLCVVFDKSPLCQPLPQRANRRRSVTRHRLYLRRQFSECPVVGRHDEQWIVTESFRATLRHGDSPVHPTAQQECDRIVDQGEGAPIVGSSLRFGHVLEQPQQVLVVGPVLLIRVRRGHLCETAGPYSRTSAQRVDAQSRVVGNGGQTRQSPVVPGLRDGVLLEGLEDFHGFFPRAVR